MPLLKSSIFNIIMTYNLLTDIDWCEQDSYQSLLVNLHNFISQKEKCSDFDNALKDKIFETYKILFENDESEKKFKEDFHKGNLFQSDIIESKTVQ